jgi:hypothetical protein
MVVDATLLWTAVGSGAATVTVVLTAVAAVAERRSARRHLPLKADESVRVVLESPGRQGEPGAALAPAVVTVLRPPTGRLPERVRGRGELLERLRVLTRAPDGQAHVLAGLGGAGKTTVALQIAEEAAAQGLAVWWVPCGDAAGVLAGLMALAAEIGASAAEVSAAMSDWAPMILGSCYCVP